MPKGASDLARHNLSFNHPCLYAASVYRENDFRDCFSARSSLKQDGEVGVSRRSVQIISRGRHVSRTLHQRTSEPKLMRRKMRVWCLGKGASGACGHRPLSVHDGCERPLAEAPFLVTSSPFCTSWAIHTCPSSPWTHLRKMWHGHRSLRKRVRENGRFGRKHVRVCSQKGARGRFSANASRREVGRLIDIGTPSGKEIP